MTRVTSTVFDHLAGQLDRLSATVGLGRSPGHHSLLKELLGAAAKRSLDAGPIWPSDISDDHSPVEFSLAFDADRPPALRLLGETVSASPNPVSNAAELVRFLETTESFGISLDRFNSVRDLFLPSNSGESFLLWYSLVLRADSSPALKVYFNPAAQGPENSREIVAEALSRLGRPNAYAQLARHALQRGDQDRLTYFAIDLHDRPHSRVKIYTTHANAEAADALRCAEAINAISADRLIDFCAIAGRTDEFSGRPLTSSYTYLSPDTDHPSGYSLYLPIRDYVSDDEDARDRVVTVLEENGFQSGLLDRAIRSLTDRSLADGSGLLAHVSLRLSATARPGVTVYLSSEAHAVARPRQLN